MVGIDAAGAVPEPQIQMVGSIGTISGLIDVLYDGTNEFIGIRDQNGNIMIMNMGETDQLVDQLRNAQSFTKGNNVS